MPTLEKMSCQQTNYQCPSFQKTPSMETNFGPMTINSTSRSSLSGPVTEKLALNPAYIPQYKRCPERASEGERERDGGLGRCGGARPESGRSGAAS
jgi:hypothetical protein